MKWSLLQSVLMDERDTKKVAAGHRCPIALLSRGLESHRNWDGWVVWPPSITTPNFPVPSCRNQVALRLAYIGDEMDLCLRSPRLAQLPGIAMHR